MKGKMLFESSVITMLLAAILFSTLVNSAFAWGIDWDYDEDTDDYSWQVSCKVQGFYDMNPDDIEQTIHDAWRGADEVNTFYSDLDPWFYFEFWYDGYTTGVLYSLDVHEAAVFGPWWPPVSTAGSIVIGYFMSESQGYFTGYAEATI